MKNKKGKKNRDKRMGPTIGAIVAVITLLIARNIDFTNMNFESGFKTVIYIPIGLAAIAALAYVLKAGND